MPDVQRSQAMALSFTFQSGGDPVTGASVSVTVTNLVDGTTAYGPTIAAESPSGSGIYTVTVPGTSLTTVAWMEAIATCTSPALYQSMTFHVGDIQPWMRTRRDIRLDVARLLGGPLAAWDMEAAGGTTTTVVLPDLNFGGDAEFNGMWARFSDRANRGLDRRLLNYDADTLTITIGPALPEGVIADDRVELYKVPASLFDRAIDDACADVADDCLQAFEYRALTSDGLSYEYQLLPSIRTVERVGLSATGSGDQYVSWLPPTDYDLRPGAVLWVSGSGYGSSFDPLNMAPLQYGPLPPGYRLAIVGGASIDPPLFDDSYCGLPPEYLTAFAHFRLSMMDQEKSVLWPYLERRKDDARKRALSQHRSGSRRVLTA